VVPLLLPLVGHPLAAAAMAAGTLLGAVAFYALLTYLPFGLFRHGRPSGRPVGRVVIGVICVALALAAMRWGLALVAFSAARTG
jgi:hypothetical protein